MRAFLSLTLLFVPALLPAAQQGPPPWGGEGRPEAVASMDAEALEMAALERFLRMSDDQLAAMAAAIDRIRSLRPEERKQLERQIAAYRQLPAPEREQIRSGWASEEDWTDWRAMMQELDEAERERIQSALQAMPFHQRAAHKHALLEAWRAELTPEE